LLAIRAKPDPELKVLDRQDLLSEMTWHASQQFEAGDLPAAERAYRNLLKEFPEDRLAMVMIAECTGKQQSHAIDMPCA